MKPSSKIVRDLFEYNPSNGLFRSKKLRTNRPRGWFAGSSSIRQYKHFYVKGQRYLAHVIAYVIVKRRWPKHEIDHINRDQSDNRWSNLRMTERRENCRNRSINANSNTGVSGVSLFKTRSGKIRYRATIGIDKKRISLGLFDDIVIAAEIRKAAELKYFGEFAP